MNHPSHYTSGKIEVIDFIEDQKFPYHLKCLKYLRRRKEESEKTTEDLGKQYGTSTVISICLEKEAAK